MFFFIKPIYKAGDENNVNNYRSIPLLSNFAKIIEKIIKQRLIPFLEGRSQQTLRYLKINMDLDRV